VKKFIFILSVGLITTMALFFYFNQSSLPLDNPEAYTQETNEWMAEKLAAQEAEKNLLDKTIDKARHLAQGKILVSFQEAELKNIDFYGRVVDQDNNPIPGVLINYDLAGVYLAPGSGMAEITTNENGEFNIDEGKGRTVDFRKMSKPGYQYKSSKMVDGSETLVYSINNTEWDKTSKKNPFTFTLWRIDRYPEVLNDSENFYPAPDELTHTFNFVNLGKPIVIKGLQDGDLQLTVDKTKPENGTVKIAAVNGGLQETDDLYPFRAPEVGYTPSFEYKIAYNSNRNRFARLFKKFYFTSRNGEIYGYIEVKINPNFNESYSAVIDYIVNKEKTRDLLVKE
jgi:hypothetical protein